MAILRLIAKSALTLIIAMTVLLGATGIAAAAPTGPIAARPSQVDFTWAGGQSQFASRYESRLNRTVFVISPDGRFEMRQPDGFPTLRGSVSGDGTFSADYRASTSVGYTRAEASGLVGVRNGVAFLNLTYTAGSAMGASVGGTQFGANNSTAYRATMTLRSA